MSARKPRCESDAELLALRETKRLLKRALKKLEERERHLLKFRKADKNHVPNEAEREALGVLYGVGEVRP